METQANYVLIGAFTLARDRLAVLFALWIAQVLARTRMGRVRHRVREAVTGLSVGGSVQYNGIQVGEVRKLALDPVDPRRVRRARARRRPARRSSADTRATLTFTGLTGVAVDPACPAEAPRLRPLGAEARRGVRHDRGRRLGAAEAHGLRRRHGHELQRAPLARVRPPQRGQPAEGARRRSAPSSRSPATSPRVAESSAWRWTTSPRPAMRSSAPWRRPTPCLSGTRRGRSRRCVESLAAVRHLAESVDAALAAIAGRWTGLEATG